MEVKQSGVCAEGSARTVFSLVTLQAGTRLNPAADDDDDDDDVKRFPASRSSAVPFRSQTPIRFLREGLTSHFVTFGWESCRDDLLNLRKQQGFFFFLMNLLILEVPDVL